MITFKEAREICGYSKRQVSDYCEIPIEEVNKGENDSEDIPVTTLIKLRRLYGIPLDIIKL